MDIAAETQSLLQSLRQDNARKQEEVRAKKEALLSKLRAKSTSIPQSQSTASQTVFSPTKKAKFQIPVARATSHPLLNGKKRMLGEIKKTALIQGADSMAKLFGYKNYMEQKEHLQKEELVRIQLMELKKKQEEEAKASNPVPDEEMDDDASDEDFVPEDEGEEPAGEPEPEASSEAAETEQILPSKEIASGVMTSEAPVHDKPQTSEADLMAAAGLSPDDESDHEDENHTSDDYHSDADDEGDSTRPRRRLVKAAVSESDSSDVEDSADAAERREKRNKDKAANYRAILAADASKNNRRRDPLSNNLVESEAEEEEEEDVLKIGGLGDFGFGVPEPKVVEKDKEDEADLVLREDDLENIVDELSDDEKDKDADDYFRERMEAQDRDEVSEVMRNVREGFGRNRRIFSSSLNGEARGRFNLDELVAADGSKKEAARLGLLESDEEGGEDDDKIAEEEEEDDEEARMERELRERYQRQPKIYITSSESESESEVEEVAPDMPSDEEREARQMKLFSAKAKINRRMQRMMQIKAQEPKAALNALDDIDDKELEQVVLPSTTTPAVIPSAPILQKRSSLSLTSSSTSFSRISDSCKRFHASASKAFVFTAETTVDDDDKVDRTTVKRKLPHSNAPLPRKKPAMHKKPSSLFSALSSYQCLCFAYALAIYVVAQALKSQEKDRFWLYMTYVLVMTCPCIWALIRCAREWDARRKIVVVKPKVKKKPDIATKKDPRVGITQAEILAAQRAKAKEIGGIVDVKKKKEKKPPKRKGPPKKKKDAAEIV
ncbi:unnamed protein product [Aphanomyces euteiches]